MSELARPATLLLARHGATDYVETWFSDEGGWLSAAGRTQAAALGTDLRARRLARVWCSDTSRAVQTAEIAATSAGLVGDVPVLTRRSLREIDAGDLAGEPFDVARLHEVTDRWFAGDLAARFPGGESGREVVDRYAVELAAIAGEHRGETVLVVGHQTALSVVVPVLTGRRDLDRSHELAHAEYAELVAHADGWRLVETLA